MTFLVLIGIALGVLAWAARKAWVRSRPLREVWESVSAWERARAR